MFHLAWTARAERDFAELQAKAQKAFHRRQNTKRKKTKAEGLSRQITKALGYLRSNPRHKSLQTHEFYSMTNPYDSAGKVFEAYAQNDTPGAYRIFWCYGPGKRDITIIAITPHP